MPNNKKIAFIRQPFFYIRRYLLFVTILLSIFFSILESAFWLAKISRLFSSIIFLKLPFGLFTYYPFLF